MSENTTGHLRPDEPYREAQNPGARDKVDPGTALMRQMAHARGKQKQRPATGEYARPYDPDAPIVERDIDALFDLMLHTLNREMDMLSRQSDAGYGLRPNQMQDLLRLSSAIAAAYRARPGRPLDPLERKPDETDQQYRERLERMK